MDEGPASRTIAEALGSAARALSGAGVTEARRDAATLLTHLLGRDRAYLFTHDDELLGDERLAAFARMVGRRAAGEPLQYITGRQEFYGLSFEVGPDVLIPRPETELLVETALELLRGEPAPLVCDVGTGSGCIAVAILHEHAGARAVALDLSPAALRVARRNAERHGVAGRVELIESDCFDALREEEGGRHFDLIASNPPYVPERDLDGLQREVRDYEPRLALTPGGDGLAVIRRLLAESPRFLAPRGHLLFEIGFGQRESVARLVDARAWEPPRVREDLQGIPRAFVLRRRGPE